MSGPILTPVVNNYSVGRGACYFDQFAPGTQTRQGEAFLGDTKTVSLTIKSTQLDHYQSTGGVKIMDQSADVQADSSGQLVTENISVGNVANFFFGSQQSIAQTAGTVTNEVVGPVIPGLYYQLGISGGANLPGAQGLNAATPATVQSAVGSTTYVAGTDYVIDYANARIQPIVGGAITSGSSIKVTYTTLAVTKTRVLSGTTPIEGALRFISNNTVGLNRIWYMPWVKLIPNGSHELIGDKFAELTFDVKALSLNGLPFLYIDGVGQ